MTNASRGLISRAAVGFAVGILICIVYWITGGIPRETWFDPQGTDQFIKSKMWFWPSAILDVVFREAQPYVAAAALYAINGLMYLAISALLFALRDRPRVYLVLCATVLGLLTWFNATVMDTFSWLWFSAVLVVLGLIAYRDLQMHRRNDASFV